MITHIHHLNFVVNDLDVSIAYFSKLLATVPTLETLPERKVKTARYQVGQTYLVLVEPTTTNGVVAEILQNKGEGIFLLSFATESIDEALLRLEIAYKNKRSGLDGWSISDLSPCEEFGAILQLTEAVKPVA